MFPLKFPYSILSHHANPGDWIIDPFCGRGTTNYAGRLLGLPSIGIDSSPVAVASSEAKLANVAPDAIIEAAEQILSEVKIAQDVPTGEFWDWAFDPSVLNTICRLREGLMRSCLLDSHKALRAILMGALHGPRGKIRQSYFSNQCQRTYAPKPRYAVKFWKSRELQPAFVDVLEIIGNRAHRYYQQLLPSCGGYILHGDSRAQETYLHLSDGPKIKWVLTSPPYYGMCTYLPDQWLRLWFVGGPSNVEYSTNGQLEHSSVAGFSDQLRKVWKNVGTICRPDARMIIRFGGINVRNVAPMTVLKESLKNSGWKIQTLKSAGFASEGRRQAVHFSKSSNNALEEYDVWAKWEG
ncbi:MAG: DNA modification methylase [Herpetosiphonaceae bacterium]|nr:DNA modification methylase [Herpetosiphonaceae bacterium]